MNYKSEIKDSQEKLTETRKKFAFFPNENIAYSPYDWYKNLFDGKIKSAVLSKKEKEKLKVYFQENNKEIFKEYVKHCHEKPKTPTNFLDCVAPYLRNQEESTFPQGKKKKSFAEKYPFLNFELELGIVTDKTLILFAQQFHKETPIIAQRTSTGYKYFPGRRKGDSRYNTEKEFEIKDHCDILENIYKYELFLTFTQNEDFREINLKEDMRQFKKRIKRMLHKLSKKYGCGYLNVFECHLDGHLHAHTALFFDQDEWMETLHEKTIRNEKGQIEKFIDSGVFFDIIHELYTAGFITIKKLPIGKAANYCRKYITKNFDSNLSKIAKMSPDDELSEDDRKMLLQLAISKATNSRSYSCTTLPNIKRRLFEKKSDSEIAELKKKYPHNEILKEIPTPEEISNKVKKDIEAEKNAARESETLLENASTNFSTFYDCKYYTGLRSTNFGKIQEVLKVTDLSLEDCKTDKSKFWILATKPIGCAGCARIEIMRYINGDFSPWFDLPPDRLTEDEIILIAKTFAENGFAKIGINPYTVDLRILAYLFPDSPIDKYLKHKFFENLDKVNTHMLNQKVSPKRLLKLEKKESLSEYREKYAKAKPAYKKEHFNF